MRKTIRTEISGAALAIAACLLLASGCAKIGEPQPPEVLIPRAATDLTAHQLADTILLRVTRPSQNKDGSAATTLASVDVFRLEELQRGAVSAPLAEDQFAGRAMRILSIPSTSLGDYRQGELLVIQDKLDFPDRTSIYSRAYRYALLFVNEKNQAAGFSNQAAVAPVPIPLPPSGLSAAVEEKSIRLLWTEPLENMDGSIPPRIAGYKIFRAEGSGEFLPVPIHPDLVRGTDFSDGNFLFDKQYRYVVRTVGSASDPYAESRPSEVIAVETRDVFPPAPPENFHALRENGGIILLWAPSPSADVAGYRIFRQESPSAPRILLQKELITALSYRDQRREGQDSYAIQAVDTHGNESAPVRTEVEVR